MPKRKRTTNSSPQADVLEKLVQSKKFLQRALKTAKGFERQKLGKRFKLAQSKGDDVSRVEREIEALKGLDLSEVAESYLYGRVAKVKRFVESGLLPEEVSKGKIEKEGLSEEEIVAARNVTSGMFNMPCVKDVMGEVLRGLYLVMGIPMPEDVSGKGKAKKGHETVPKSILKAPTAEASYHNGRQENEEPAWDGFESGAEEVPDINAGDDDMDSEDLSRYDALLGDSDSDSDSNALDDSDNDEGRAIQHIQKPSKPTKQVSLSLSPSPPPPSAKRTKTKTKTPAPTPKSTTFLPTLLGGYFSGSESSASDIEDAAPPVRKNRPGQMARRAIWEKKFGEKANHVKSGKLRVAEMGSNARRANDRKGRGGGFHENRGTGENAMEVAPKKRGMGRKDDDGVLHPSWQAAKAAKEAKKNATFQGKKVTFD